MSEKRIKERCKREDIALKIVEGFLEKYCDENTELYYSLETLLDLYKKQKEKDNKMVVAYGGRRYNTEGIILKDYISKDKIRKIIGKLEKQKDWYTENKLLDDLYGKIDILQELLEERN